MRLHLTNGPVRIGLPTLFNAISKLKTLSTVADARFAAVKSAQQPQVTRGYGLAHAIASVAKGSHQSASDLKHECRAIADELHAEVSQAQRALDHADRHASFLIDCANHIATGQPIADPDFDPRLSDAARTLRSAKLLDTTDGLVEQTMAVLRQEHIQQVVKIAEAKDFLRRRRAALRMATLANEVKVYTSAAKSAALPTCILPEHEKSLITQRLSAATKAAAAYKDAYHKAFFDNKRKTPKVSAARGTVVRYKSGSFEYVGAP